MALKDYYNIGDDTWFNVRSAIWGAQLFIASSAYDISSIKLLSRKAGDLSGMTFTVAIRATSGDQPTGGNLVSVSVDADTLNTDFLWNEFTFASSYSLSNSVKYAIVFYLSAGDVSKRIDIKYDSTGNYSNGIFCWSGNSGGSWTEVSASDFLFENYDESGGGVASPHFYNRLLAGNS